MKYAMLLGFSLLFSFAVVAEPNCQLKDVGHLMNKEKVIRSHSHVTTRFAEANTLEECLALAKQKLGTEYDAEITTRRRHHRITRMQHFKVTKVKYGYIEPTYQSRGMVKLNRGEWDQE